MVRYAGRFVLLVRGLKRPRARRGRPPRLVDTLDPSPVRLAEVPKSRMRIGKRHSQDFVVGVRLERFDASVSVPLSGLQNSGHGEVFHLVAEWPLML
jgi:hypothetical protein